MEKGKIIVIDGMDGTGKETQSRLLYEKLRDRGDKVEIFSFPNYREDSSYFVKKFLREGYCREENPVLHHFFFAIDRGITFAKEIKEKYEQGYTIIFNRYTTSEFIFNLQNYHTDEIELFYDMLYTIEMEYLRLPEPDLVIVLYSDPEISNKLMDSRYNNDDSKRDLNENIEFQTMIYKNILYLKENKIDIFGPTMYLRIHDDNKELYTRNSTNYTIMLGLELI